MNEQRVEGPVKDYLTTFKFHDSKRRRLSIFARIVEETKLEITVLTTSLTLDRKMVSTPTSRTLSITLDTFSKKEGHEKYAKNLNGTWFKGKTPKKNEKMPGQRFVVDIAKDEENGSLRPRYTFLKWCNDRYYRPVEEEKTIKVVKYVRGRNYVHKKKEKENGGSKSKETA